MSDLIVDFPRERSSPEAVRFDPMVDVQFFERVRNKNKLWYQDEDYLAMKKARRVSVIEVHRTYLDHPSGPVDQLEKLGACTTGIENMLSPKILRRVQVCKARCLNAVLDEQDRQDKYNEYDPMKIAAASLKHSNWSATRAHTIGLLQSSEGFN